jgi:hypothetical protein
MEDEHAELDRLQAAYRAAVEEWVTAIRAEAALASVHHSVAELDAWENAHFVAEALRAKVEAAKSEYEAVIRAEFFGID